jgi:hypothetical protein
MTGREFYDAVEREEKLEWLGFKEGGTPEESEVFIKSDACGQRGVKHAIPLTSIIENSEEVLEVLLGKRAAKIMMHLTRIVGYYSRVSNWNRSKLGELADRRAGNYGLPEERSGQQQDDGNNARTRRRRTVPLDSVLGVVGAGV